MQVARKVRFPINTNKRAEFTKLFTNEVLPVLRKQEGFKDEIMLVNDKQVVGISVWSGLDAMHKYEKTTYPTIEKMLAGMLSGTADVETYEMTPLNTTPA